MKPDCPPQIGERSGPDEVAIRLRGGSYVIRPMGPDDEQRLREFFYSHTCETIQLRYGYTINAMSHERAFGLVNVDQQKDVALGIFERQGGQQVLDAVGRYYSDPGGKVAEIAFVVRERKRRCGMAGTLIRRLAEIAHRRGIESFVANVLWENEEMRSLFARFGPRVSSTIGSEWLTYHLEIEKILASPCRRPVP